MYKRGSKRQCKHKSNPHVSQQSCQASAAEWANIEKCLAVISFDDNHGGALATASPDALPGILPIAAAPVAEQGGTGWGVMPSVEDCSMGASAGEERAMAPMGADPSGMCVGNSWDSMPSLSDLESQEMMSPTPSAAERPTDDPLNNPLLAQALACPPLPAAAGGISRVAKGAKKKTPGSTCRQKGRPVGEQPIISPRSPGDTPGTATQKGSLQPQGAQPDIKGQSPRPLKTPDVKVGTKGQSARLTPPKTQAPGTESQQGNFKMTRHCVYSRAFHQAYRKGKRGGMEASAAKDTYCTSGFFVFFGGKGGSGRFCVEHPLVPASPCPLPPSPNTSEHLSMRRPNIQTYSAPSPHLSDPQTQYVNTRRVWAGAREGRRPSCCGRVQLVRRFGGVAQGGLRRHPGGRARGGAAL